MHTCDDDIQQTNLKNCFLKKFSCEQTIVFVATLTNTQLWLKETTMERTVPAKRDGCVRSVPTGTGHMKNQYEHQSRLCFTLHSFSFAVGSGIRLVKVVLSPEASEPTENTHFSFNTNESLCLIHNTVCTASVHRDTADDQR